MLFRPFADLTLTNDKFYHNAQSVDEVEIPVCWLGEPIISTLNLDQTRIATYLVLWVWVDKCGYSGVIMRKDGSHEYGLGKFRTRL